MSSSTRWAAPVSANRWFDAELLERSRAFHGPLARAALWRSGFQAVGLALAFGIAWWLTAAGLAGLAGALAIGALVSCLASWLPCVMVDSWMEYRHQPRFTDASSLPVGRFLVVAAVSGVGVGGLGAVVSGLVHLAVRATTWWPLLVIVGGGGFMTVAAWSGLRLGYRSEPLEAEVEAELALVASAGGVPGVIWGRMVSPDEPGINAASVGGIGPAQVLCTEALLDADHDLRDFVIAHEVSHLRRGHHRRAFALSLAGLTAEVASLWAADRWVLQRLDGGLANPRLWPLAVAIVAMTAAPVALIEAWRSRSHERQADLDASATVGVPGIDALRSLHEHDRSDLDPGLLARLLAPHPSPAERLMQADRESG